MIFYQNTTDFSIDGQCAVTLGKFDGFHRGHQILMKELFEAGKQGLKTVVFTFGTNPRALVTGQAEELLLTNGEKKRMLEKKGVDVLIEYPFNDTVAHMSPQAFVREVLVSRLHAKKIIVGSDFGFGYRRAGNAALLREMSRECGYELTVMEKIKTKEGLDISSTYIKELLKLGHMEQVNDLLGYVYSIQGEVVHGNHYGRTFGMPTINQIPEPNKLLPPNGVYVSQTEIDGVTYPSVTNIGVKPSIDGAYPRGVETFIHDFNRDVYGRQAEVRLYSYARPEMKFASREDLIAQMHRDNETARLYWGD